MKERALFIFRRDLRLIDNTGLNFACDHFKEVIPIFIFTPEQVEKNPYKSQRALQFMIESLKELDLALKEKGSRLFFFSGKVEDVVQECIHTLSCHAVIVNEDYTPYSQKRDHKIAAICQKQGVEFHSFEDLLLHPKDTLKPYRVFTPFYKAALKIPVLPPHTSRKNPFYTKKIPSAQHPLASLEKASYFCGGGRQEGLLLLKKAKLLVDYGKNRDFPDQDQTSHLSAHLKFMTLSIREVYAALCHNPDLIRSLYWRDFFTLTGFHFPHVFKGAFQPRFDQIKWDENPHAFKRWTEGMTGFPLVDAGMRELKTTGRMHNRVRMVASSFLIKDLHIHWRLGERYFAQELIDYDPSVNNGNWQWIASTGCDAQPYFRIFNPWSQQKRFDPECLYIKKWIPELSSFSPKEIHQLESRTSSLADYPLPMVEHRKESQITLKRYKNAH